MRLVEEVLVQADDILKGEINTHLDKFVAAVKRYSTQKGCRWDDIVIKFEYEAIEAPKMVQLIEKSHINAGIKPMLIKRVEQHHELDLKGIELLVEHLSLIENPQ